MNHAVSHRRDGICQSQSRTYLELAMKSGVVTYCAATAPWKQTQAFFWGFFGFRRRHFHVTAATHRIREKKKTTTGIPPRGAKHATRELPETAMLWRKPGEGGGGHACMHGWGGGGGAKEDMAVFRVKLPAGSKHRSCEGGTSPVIMPIAGPRGPTTTAPIIFECRATNLITTPTPTPPKTKPHHDARCPGRGVRLDRPG